MSTGEVPIKPRRKKLEVQVHSQHSQSNKRSYSANFNGRKHKHRSTDEYLPKSPKTGETHEHDKVPECDKSKISRKDLYKENLRLIQENQEITAKFNELEQLSVNKITKLKEKIQNLGVINEEITNENVYVRTQFQDLIKNVEELKKQLELTKVCRSCEEFKVALEQMDTDNNLLRETNLGLAEDLRMLKTVVFRLNSQLERYQDKLRKLNVQDLQKLSHLHNIPAENATGTEHTSKNVLSAGHTGHNHTPISWGKVNSHTLGPLLDAFQDTINEKEDIINNYEVELSNFTGKLKEVLSENESLYQQLTEDENCSRKLKNELENTRKELNNCKEQNDILIKKCAIKQDKLDEILKCYENRVDQLKRDYSVLHEQYCLSRNEIAALKEKNKTLIDSQDEFRNERQNYIPVSVHTASVNECKKWYEELKRQYEVEKAKMNENLNNEKKLLEELREKISKLTQNKSDLETKIKQMEKALKKGETKCLDLEHALNEVQLARSACKKQLHKAMNFAKELVTEQETLLKALNERVQENKAVTKIGSDMAARMDTLRNQLKNVQRDAWQELTTVEERIKEQSDTIDKMQEEHNQEIIRLKQIIQSQSESALKQNLPIAPYLLIRDRHKTK